MLAFVLAVAGGAAPQTAAEAFGVTDPRAYSVGVGTGPGSAGGAVVGGVAGAALFAYGLDAALDGSRGPGPLETVALVSSPFVAAAGVAGVGAQLAYNAFSRAPDESGDEESPP